MPPATRIGDVSTGDPCGAGPHASVAGSGTVSINGIPAVRVGDAYEPHACPASSPHSSALAAGSGTVFIDGIPAGRIGDAISCGSSVAVGSSDVFIGG